MHKQKTPEELAEECVNTETTGSETYEHGLRTGFLAGYHTRDEEIEFLKREIKELERDLKTFIEDECL
jgi:hypothetical protein